MFDAKDGWKVSIFYDCGELDYIHHFVAPDGEVIDFWEWPVENYGPDDAFDGSLPRNRLIAWRGVRRPETEEAATSGFRPTLELWAEIVATEEEAFWREVEERRTSGLPQLSLERRNGFAHPPASIEIQTSIFPMSRTRPYVCDTQPTQEEKAVGEAVWRLLAEAEAKA